MAVDPTDPEIFEEQGTDTVELGVEAPEHTAAERFAEITAEQDEPLTEEETLRANEADLVEQKRVIKLDEDDYR
ncbi:hypothetical protein [Streptomyces colonosanans]|uniref:Uncharacterized protein n=1 Tax=Streptomyces colonosanans TaxID=1428652 RepID=A0A1S2PJR6_9ACTN|nr:hypothetical protein [Streptomyces colonosanans]OIJ93204.1 hypothetical protein BIV24_12525 [Streptomyces colonosanans]